VFAGAEGDVAELSCAPPRLHPGGYEASGSVSRNVVPLALELSSWIVPAWPSVIAFAIERPRPVR
jgi:hypothetical protein